MANNKMLYFATGAADDSGASEEIIMVPVENISHFEVAGTAALDIWFKAGQEGTLANDYTKVNLVVTAGAGNMKTVLQALTQLINTGPHSDGFLVVADDENSVYCNPLITGCNAITVTEAA